MKAILMGDIHANLPALEAVLTHAGRFDAAAVWNVGDLVGYGAFPEEVVQRLRREGIASIAGNYDRKVLKFPRKQAKWRESKRPEKFAAFQWAYEHLSESSRRYLEALPDELRLQAGGREILLTHGSPASNKEPLVPETPVERLQALAQQALADIIICGHSHRPFARTVDASGQNAARRCTWFINTGSVGRPDDGDPRACYALLELDAGQVRAQHFRVEYDIQRAAVETRRRGLPEAFAQMILQGRDLDTVLSR